MFFPPSLTDLQPVKIQLNNSVRSAFPTPFTTHSTHTYSVGTHAHTHTVGSQQYDIWIVIAACGECVFLLTADLYLRLHFVFRLHLFSLPCFSPPYLLQLVLPTRGYKHINPFFPFLSFSKLGSETWSNWLEFSNAFCILVFSLQQTSTTGAHVSL